MSDDARSSDSVDPGPEPAYFRQVAAQLNEQISEISQSVQVSLANLDDSIRSVPLAEADRLAAVCSEDLRAAMRTVVVNAKLRHHDQQALSKARAEPETLREWVGTLATGNVSLALASASGALSMRLLQLALIAGLIGLSVQSTGTLELIERAKTLELALMVNSNEAELTQAARSAPIQGDASSCEVAPDICADDATTVTQLRTMFRTGAARALQQEIHRVGGAVAETRRAAFELGAMDARHAILAQAERPAAPALDPGAEVHDFRSSPLLRSGASSEADILDEAFNRRVETLKAHEPIWSRLRAWAAQPVPANYAADAFVRTVLGDVNGPALHSVLAWSEQASFQFTSNLMRGGDPAAAVNAMGRRQIETPFHFGTARDERIFRDFSAGVPERVNAELAAYSSGEKDPGSLRRSFANTGAHVTNSYNELFPAASPADLAGAPRGAITEGRAFINRASARSYARVRFSGRVGGVVFGRPADPGGAAPDVVDLRWEMRNEKNMTLAARMRDGNTIQLGSYHPAIIHQALAFVADGRVVVATLPQPMEEPGQLLTIPARRVVVHPALEDTAFACDTIQIDRFVDAFTGSRQGSQESARLQNIEDARNGVTYLGAILASSNPISDEVADKWLGRIQRHLSNCKGDEQCFPIKYYREMGIDFGPVESFLGCLRNSSDATLQRACLANFSVKRTGNTYLVDSGVRERAYKVDPHLTFVSGVGHRDEKTWPIEFVIQAVPQLAHEGDLDIGGGHDPWQFPAIADDVQAAVVEGIEGNPNAQDVFRNVRDFVALQRFFRTALSGELGEAFPLDALVRLSSETKRYVRVQRNERWNVNDQFLAFAQSAVEYSLHLLQNADPQIQSGGRCRQRVDEILSKSKKPGRAGFFGFWGSFAKIDVDCGSEPPLSKLIELLRELRRQDVIGQILELEHMAGTEEHGPLYCAAL